MLKSKLSKHVDTEWIATRALLPSFEYFQMSLIELLPIAAKKESREDIR